MTQKIMLKTKLLSRTSCSAFLQSLTCGSTTIMIIVSLLLLSPTLAGDRTANTTANTTAQCIAQCIASKDTQNLQCGCLSDTAAWLWRGQMACSASNVSATRWASYLVGFFWRHRLVRGWDETRTHGDRTFRRSHQSWYSIPLCCVQLLRPMVESIPGVFLVGILGNSRSNIHPTPHCLTISAVRACTKKQVAKSFQ